MAIERSPNISPPELCALASAATFYGAAVLPPGTERLLVAAASAVFVTAAASRFLASSRARSRAHSLSRATRCRIGPTGRAASRAGSARRHPGSARRHPGRRRHSVIVLAASLGVIAGGFAGQRTGDPRAGSFIGIRTGMSSVRSELVATDDARAAATGEAQLWGRLIRVCTETGCAEAAGRVFVRDHRLEGALSGDRVVVRGRVDRGDGVFFLSPERGRGAIEVREGTRALLRLRRTVVRAFSSTISGWPAAERGVFAALFAGDRSALPATLERRMREAGASHILALSGMHLGIISAAVFAVARRLLRPGPASAAVCVFAVAYLVFAGFRPSLVRAVIMLCVAAAIRRRDGVVQLPVVLALTFLVQQLLFPDDLRSLAFGLSFLSLLGLVFLSPALYHSIPPIFPRVIRAGVAAGTAAQVSTAPLVFSSFGAVHPAGIVASIALTPVAVAIIACGAGAIVAGPVSVAILPVLSGSVALLDRLAAAAALAPSVTAAPHLALFLLTAPCLLAACHVSYRIERIRWRRRFHAYRDRFRQNG